MADFDVETYLAEATKRHAKMKLTKEDVWGTFSTVYPGKRDTPGMIVARSGDKCPIFKDKVPYKSVTVVCELDQSDEVEYWLNYVHGGDSISKTKTLPKGKIAIRSDYMCW